MISENTDKAKDRLPFDESNAMNEYPHALQLPLPKRKFFLCKGFTLLELMIVISIIAVLTCLLLPSLSMSRQKGKEIACKGNLKQIGLGAICYSNDYNEWCVAAQPAGSGNRWGAAMVDLKYTIENALKCPSETIFNLSSGYNYGLNWLTFGYTEGHATARPVKIQSVSRLGRNSSVIYFADTPPNEYETVGVGFVASDGIFGWSVVYPVNSAGAYYPIYVRHNLKANAVIFDGHVESLKSTELINRPALHLNPTQRSFSPGVLGILNI